MAISETYPRLLEIAREEFAHLIDDGGLVFTAAGSPQKLRLDIIDGSVVDVFLSPTGEP